MFKNIYQKFCLLAFLASGNLFAKSFSGGGGLPWESVLDKILASLQGPVAKFGVVAAIIITGIGLAFGEHGSGFKKFMGIAFGGAIILGATTMITTLFGATF